ncbi:CU044_2847 family protein [Streptomyces mirabilis]|uniref:CU044_2847 family protein n=1 Tax=Streptomyces mirabilis TaxID=68239 RepID=UPI00381DF9C6
MDDETLVQFEIEPSDEFQPVSADQVISRVKDAVRPAVDAAHAVLDCLAEARPDEVEVKFGIKVNGTANWLVARAATEANFEITLTWSSSEAASGTASPS